MVEAHATVLNQMRMLLSNHVVRGVNCMRSFDLGVKLNGDVVEQSCSKGVNGSETF